MNLEHIKIIAFDADDTLWINESYFRATEEALAVLLKDYEKPENTLKILFETEMQNLPIYGYGIKGFVLSMVETALKIDKNIPQETIAEILQLGKNLLDQPVEVLDNVADVLAQLQKKYTLVLATKGDLLDQERKLEKSGLVPFFHHIEVMSEKDTKNYQQLLKHLDCAPENFLMVGNSIKSDILPILSIGGNAIYIPFHTTWQHELVDTSRLPFVIHQVEGFRDLLVIL